MWLFRTLLEYTQIWYTITFDHGEFFRDIFEFLRFFWNPIWFFGFHFTKNSKNRISWFSKCSKKSEKFIFEFYTQMRSYKPILRRFLALLVFPQGFQVNYWNILKCADIVHSQNRWKILYSCFEKLKTCP